MTATPWIEVDRAGLAQVIADRPKSFLLYELIQNSLDEPGVTKINVEVETEGWGKHRITVTDNSTDGYEDIRHAWTLYAPSKKKGDATLRGRFNVGCKMVLALAVSAQVISTKSAVLFSATEGRRRMNRRRKRGTQFLGIFNMSKNAAYEMVREAFKLLPPDGVVITVNGDRIPYSAPTETCVTQLPTVIADADGALRPTKRQTTIELHEPRFGETPTLYEMGIPVVELDGDDPWHVNVMQRVPLNTDRDNVTPAYLRTLRVAVLNVAHGRMTPESAKAVWATEASEDERCEQEAVETVLTHRFGTKRVAFDPSDPEANMLAASKGYTVIAGGSLTKGQWQNARDSGSVLPAGKVTPSPRVESSADGIPPLPEEEWTEEMVDTAEMARRLSGYLNVHPDISVTWYSDAKLTFAAYWGQGGQLGLNKPRVYQELESLAEGDHRPMIALLIHEFAHEAESNHLSEGYHRELCRLGSGLIYLNAGDLF